MEQSFAASAFPLVVTLALALSTAVLRGQSTPPQKISQLEVGFGSDLSPIINTGTGSESILLTTYR